MSVILQECRADVLTDRFEHHIDGTFNTEPRPEGRDVDLMRTKVMKNCRAAIEQGLDINKFPRPVFLLENSLT